MKAARSGAGTAMAPQAYVQEALRWLPEAIRSDGAGKSHARRLDPLPCSRRFAATFGARIVFADDNADMRAYVRELLAPHYSVEAVVDGAAALEAALRQRADLLLSDIMMPRLDGFGLLKAVRQDEV